MIIEDYVSFEIAKLLKEKGFVGEREIGCRCGFYEQNKEYPNQINLVYDDLNNSELECNECLRFTLQMAMKWLREVHNIFIQVELYSKYNDYCFELFQNTHRLILKQHETYNSYEEAVEAALEYTLKKLL